MGGAQKAARSGRDCSVAGAFSAAQVDREWSWAENMLTRGNERTSVGLRLGDAGASLNVRVSGIAMAERIPMMATTIIQLDEREAVLVASAPFCFLVPGSEHFLCPL